MPLLLLVLKVESLEGRESLNGKDSKDVNNHENSYKPLINVESPMVILVDFLLCQSVVDLLVVLRLLLSNVPSHLVNELLYNAVHFDFSYQLLYVLHSMLLRYLLGCFVR